MSDSIDISKYKLADEPTPVNEQLTSHYKRSYAFFTMSERLPTIISNIVDQLSRDKDIIIQKYGEVSREELKLCIGEISKLKYELQTDKKMTEIAGDESDQFEWNKLLKEIEPNNSYFSAVWLYAECYIYRRIRSIFAETTSLKEFDYFENQKRNELKNSMTTIKRVIKSVNEFNATAPTSDQVGDFFRKLVKVNLWGNRHDLSITLGKEIEQFEGDPVADIETYNNELLVDDTLAIWNCLTAVTSEAKTIDIINDNSGYELLCDFVLADFIIHHKLAKRIRFRVKAIPWFISDVLPSDFKYTISELKRHETSTLCDAGTRWDEYIANGEFLLIEPADHFFTSPYEYCKMERVSLNLYRSIAESHLVIIKGDLNYRKLLSDINWAPTTDFRVSLSGFEPTNLCALRTVKADLISGLEPGKAEALFEAEGANWMTTGKYGVIQFASKRVFTE